jgi:superfamily II DNA or RNA helicase
MNYEAMDFGVGSLVRARGREWVVLPPETDDPNWLLLQPLGGSRYEITGINKTLEMVTSASFALPDPKMIGDARVCDLLREAVRLGFRSTSGPFRSFGHIAVEPRPYQLVPLLMALRQSTIRLLIADDVGIGKTIEAAIIARELLDRGEISRLSVICPPQLTGQWQAELESKFHIQAAPVLPSTVRKLERGLDIGTSLFEEYPYTIVSLDYIKSSRHIDEFLRTCPELVIVDEAHACASPTGGKAAMQRHNLIKILAEDTDRHMIFVTATPHSGKNEVFRSLLAFLNPSFGSLPDDLSGSENKANREELAKHFIQRRRSDIKGYLETDTPFPERVHEEKNWVSTIEAKGLFEAALNLARENIEKYKNGTKFQQRISWWSALALLRAVGSSPAAAAATLRNRAAGLDFPDNVELVDEVGRFSIFDTTEYDGVENMDTVPGSDDSELESVETDKILYQKRLTGLAKEAEALCGKKDSKLGGLCELLKKVIADGFQPIVFTRFIHTAEYLAEQLRPVLSDVYVDSVTGILPPEEREYRISELGTKPRRLLVCTDCLSEGINLQEHFNAVIHYDLPWNPSRLEQREGRVDRFGQPSPEVKVITYYSPDSPIDGMILKVLLRKYEAIRKDLGVCVSLPENSDKLTQAILEGILFLDKDSTTVPKSQKAYLPGLEPKSKPESSEFSDELERIANRERKRSLTMFAHQAIKAGDVAIELKEANEAAGDSLSVRKFVVDVLTLMGASHMVKERSTAVEHFDFSLQNVPLDVKRHLDLPETIKASFSLPVQEDQIYLSRTHPLVETLATYTLNTALDSATESITRRCGVMRTKDVTTRTTLLLCRFRFLLKTQKNGQEHSCLTEEAAFLAFAGAPEKADWLESEKWKDLVLAQPTANINPELASGFVEKVVSNLNSVRPYIHKVMKERATKLLEAHRRVRSAAKIAHIKYDVKTQGEPDILGVFVYLPHLD